MQALPRKSTPRVIEGRVQTKNNRNPSTNYYYAPEPHTVVIDRKRPGEGYRHVLNKSDLHRFLEILPDWEELAVGLNAIVLAPGRETADGYHVPGVVHICAWESDLWSELTPEYYMEHRDIFERLGVIGEEQEDGYYLCRFDEESARGYQLMHILLHELGHHHDRMTTRYQRRACRGERYAEEYARRHEATLWQRYRKAFAL